VVATDPALQTSGAKPELASGEKPAHTLNAAESSLQPAAYFADTLNDAERLLKYAAETTDIITDLQQFASINRAIDARARQLDFKGRLLSSLASRAGDM